MIPHAADPQLVADSLRDRLARLIGGTTAGDELIVKGEHTIHCDVLGRVWLYRNRADGGSPLGKVSDGADVLARNYGAMTR